MTTEADVPCTNLKSQLIVVSEFLDSLKRPNDETLLILNVLTSQRLLKSVIYELWSRFLADKSSEKELENDKNRAQLSLIFRNFDSKTDKMPSNFREICLLMATGSINGTTPTTATSNIFPSGFWALPILKESLSNRLFTSLQELIRETASVHYALPLDWVDEKNPDGLYIHPNKQASDLLDALVFKYHTLTDPEPSGDVKTPAEGADEPSTTESPAVKAGHADSDDT